MTFNLNNFVTGNAHATDDDESAGTAERISQRWNLTDPIVSGWTRGGIADGSAIVFLRCASGKVLRLQWLGDLFEARTHTRIVSLATRTRFVPLTNAQAVEIAQLIIELCGGQDVAPTEEAHQWVTDFLTTAASNIVTADLDTAGLPDWPSLKRRADLQAALTAERDTAARTAILHDSTGDFWVPASALRAHADARMAWNRFTTRLAEIGWRRIDIDRREPGVARPAARHIHTVFYTGPDITSTTRDEREALRGINYAALRTTRR
jgi:hypothetical protein